MYSVILKEKREQNNKAKHRLVVGLQVLEKAAEAIAQLKLDIDKMQPELEQTKKELETTMQDLTVKREVAANERAIVAKDEADARVQESEASALKQEAETELAKATPLLEEATRVLKEIKKDDLYFIQSLKAPSGNICLVMEFACHMFNLKPKPKNMNRSPNDAGGFFDLAKL